MKRLHDKDELIFKGRVLELRRVVLQADDGEQIQRELVHYNGAAVILPVLADGRIVLIRNYRFAAGEWLWELPAGNLSPGEDPAEAAGRELVEETGYRAGRLTRLGEFLAAPGSSDERLYSFLATELEAGPQQLEPHEQIVVEARSDSEVRGMVVRGEIHDAKTIATLAQYWLQRSPLTKC